MQRKNLFKTIIIVVAIVWGLWELYPTIKLGGVKKQTDELKAELCSIAGIERGSKMLALILSIKL